VDKAAPYLSDAFVQANYEFYGKTLRGQKEIQPRWKRVLNTIEGQAGEALGQMYVEVAFPAESKARMQELVGNLSEALKVRIENLEWMGDETKAKAMEKWAAFTPKIGYPDKWRDFSGLSTGRDSYIGNVMAANRFNYQWQLSKIGEPVDRTEWGMSPQTVNAYYNPLANEIVFPAAILQPPFFDPNADPAINYGGIGAVIGHEISHHFDDQGAKYDEQGRLADWWTPDDLKAFEAAGKALIAQYDAYQIFPGANIKGDFTLGENIGDLAGLTVAYDAYRHSLGGGEAPVLNGTTGDQRFYLGWAQVWRRNYREANLRQRLITDPHAPSEQRVWVVRNLDPWYSAFNVRAGQRLYLAPEARVRIW
jgi:putative endopeptidase